MKTFVAFFSLAVSCVAQGAAAQIDFLSVGTGVNRAALEAAQEILADSVQQGAVSLFRQQHWGREGERTLCVQGNASSDDEILWNSLLPVAGFELVTLSAAAGCADLPFGRNPVAVPPGVQLDFISEGTGIDDLVNDAVSRELAQKLVGLTTSRLVRATPVNVCPEF